MFHFLYFLRFVVCILYIHTERGAARGPKKLLAQRKVENDPTLSQIGQQLQHLEFEQKDKWLLKQASGDNPTVFLINEWKHPHYTEINTRKFKDETWKFGRKAKYAQKRDKDGNILRYGNCSWNRIFCDLCDTAWYAGSATAFRNHLKVSHKADAIFMDIADKEAFCRVTGIDIESLADDPDSIEKYHELNTLINEYYLTHPDSLPIQRTPLSLAKCGGGMSKIFHTSLMELIVALGSTPNAAQKRALNKFINVCINFVFYVIYFKKNYIFSNVFPKKLYFLQYLFLKNYIFCFEEQQKQFFLN